MSSQGGWSRRPSKPAPLRSGLRNGLREFGVQQAIARLMAQSLKIAAVGVMALLIVVGGLKFFAYERDAANRAAGVGQSVTITIRKKDDVATVARKLHAAGLIRSELYFTSMLRLKSAVVVPGSYTLPMGLSVSEIVRIISR